MRACESLWPVASLRAAFRAVAVVAVALIVTACSKTPVAIEAAVPFDAQKHCFSAIAGGSPSAREVFARKGRSGNGETWLALLLHALEEHTTLGPETAIREMGFGYQRRVAVDGRDTWIGFDVEAGAATLCTPDGDLRAWLKTTYEDARRDPAQLEALIDAVPAGSWDD